MHFIYWLPEHSERPFNLLQFCQCCAVLFVSWFKTLDVEMTCRKAMAIFRNCTKRRCSRKPLQPHQWIKSTTGPHSHLKPESLVIVQGTTQSISPVATFRQFVWTFWNTIWQLSKGIFWYQPWQFRFIGCKHHPHDVLMIVNLVTITMNYFHPKLAEDGFKMISFEFSKVA